MVVYRIAGKAGSAPRKDGWMQVAVNAPALVREARQRFDEALADGDVKRALNAVSMLGATAPQMPAYHVIDVLLGKATVTYKDAENEVIVAVA